MKLKFSLKELLQETNKTQKEFADEIGISKQAINGWVRTNKIPTDRLGDVVELIELAYHATGKYSDELEQLHNMRGWF